MNLHQKPQEPLQTSTVSGQLSLYTEALKVIQSVPLFLMGKCVLESTPEGRGQAGAGGVLCVLPPSQKGSLHPGLLLMSPGVGTGLTTQGGWEQPLALMRQAA